VSIARDAIPGAGGWLTGAGYRAGFSAGLPLAGIAAGTGFEEIAGFWGWITRGTSDVPGFGPGGALPALTELGPVLPNPVATQAVLRFQISGTAGATTPVRLEIFDVSGRSAGLLVDEALAPGFYEATWDRAAAGGIAHGVYFARLTTSLHTRTVKLVAAR